MDDITQVPQSPPPREGEESMTARQSGRPSYVTTRLAAAVEEIR